jgi:hypothetical protein
VFYERMCVGERKRERERERERGRASVQHSESRKIMSRKIMRADQCRLAIGDSQA